MEEFLPQEFLTVTHTTKAAIRCMKVNAGMWRVWTDIFPREPTHIVDASCGHDGLHKNLSTVVEEEKPQVRAKGFKKGDSSL